MVAFKFQIAGKLRAMARKKRKYGTKMFVWTIDLDLQILSQANKARADIVAIDDMGNAASVTQIHKRMADLRQFDVDIAAYLDCPTNRTGRRSEKSKRKRIAVVPTPLPKKAPVCIRGKFKSKFKGVSWNRKMKKWVVTIHKNGKGTYLGMFDDEIDAARMHEEADNYYEANHRK